MFPPDQFELSSRKFELQSINCFPRGANCGITRLSPLLSLLFMIICSIITKRLHLLHLVLYSFSSWKMHSLLSTQSVGIKSIPLSLPQFPHCVTISSCEHLTLIRMLGQPLGNYSWMNLLSRKRFLYYAVCARGCLHTLSIPPNSECSFHSFEPQP